MARTKTWLLAAAMAVGWLGGVAIEGVAHAAINPAHYQRVASHRLQLHETARVVHEFEVGGHRWRRTTVVGTVVAVHDGIEGPMHAGMVGDSITIDFCVDLDAREAAGDEWERRNGTMPGPQFLAEPDPPEPDEAGNFWAHLAPLGGRLGNVNRHAGAVYPPDGAYAARGAVFVPVGAQYSFMSPMD